MRLGSSVWCIRSDRNRRPISRRFSREVGLATTVKRTADPPGPGGQADAPSAVSSGDNSNIISARLARETFGVARVVARIYDPKRAEVYERLGIPTVATVRWTADRIFRQLVPDGHQEVWRDPTSVVAIVEVPVHPGWISRPVRALE